MNEQTQTESASTDTERAVHTAICDIIGAELGVRAEWVDEATSMAEIPGMESLRMLRAVTKVEKHFGVELPDDAVFNIQRVNELTRLVIDRMEACAHG